MSGEEYNACSSVLCKVKVMFYLTTLATAEVISASPDVPEFYPAGVLLHASKSTDMSVAILADTAYSLRKKKFDAQIICKSQKEGVRMIRERATWFTKGRLAEAIKLVLFVSRLIMRTASFLGLVKLSFIIHTDDDIDNKISKFLNIAGTIKSVFKSSQVQRHTRLKIYKTLALPVLAYGSEAWTLRKCDERRLTTAEMRFMRKTAGYSLLDHHRNVEILKKLKIDSTVHYLQQYRLQWQTHAKRMDRSRWPRQILSYVPRGRRNLGRPRKRWQETYCGWLAINYSCKGQWLDSLLTELSIKTTDNETQQLVHYRRAWNRRPFLVNNTGIAEALTATFVQTCQTDTKRDRQRQRDTERRTETQRETDRDTERYRETDRDKERQTDTERDRDGERQTGAQREIDSYTDRHKERQTERYGETDRDKKRD
ncbi:hypothetical protein ANN_14639 [Periplaneta americana]|uniref:Uncharacterized protein n=1 Tax=Periplaneta americana TaxID=6978 RepID=A0ABQ8SYF9_PERAM|nr:hypothetical protein ANN_14639 [Periplaneta americana]